ncbi:MAG: hypothetical protein NT062_30555 [Proteobacteria bacterium]|nr:hypothetical protein [Pseudomonadota bacterium]
MCTLNEVMTNATLATIQLINAVPDQLPDDEAERHAAVSLAVVPLQRDLAQVRHTAKRTGLALAIGGLVVGGLGAALYLTTDKPYALAVSGVGGGLLAGGVTILAF